MSVVFRLLCGQVEAGQVKKMGGCVSVSEVIDVGEKILSEFDSMSFFGKILQAVSSKNHCSKPESCSDLGETMRCSFMKSQRGPWEIVIVSWIVSVVGIPASVSYHIFYSRKLRDQSGTGIKMLFKILTLTSASNSS